MNIKKIVLIAVAATACIAGGLLAFFYFFNHAGTVSAGKAPRVVKLFRISDMEKGGGVTYPGRVWPVRHAELFFRVSGPVIERNLKYGQTVEQGDILMRIDPRDYQREVDRLTQEVAMQRVQNSLAEIEYNRNLKLIESKVVSQAVFDTARTKKQASDAELQMLEVELKIAQDKLADTVLTAPFHGTISDLKIEQYEIAKANVPVVLLDDLREVEIRISVPAGNLPDTNIYDGEQFLGMKFDVRFPGRGNRLFQASTYEFKPVASETSETYELTLRMKVPDDFLVLPGMSAEVFGLPHFQSDRRKRLKLPFAAIFERDGRSSVWVYSPKTQTITRRDVKAGEATDADRVYIEGDVHPGELVVAAGGDWLTEKTSVRILNPEVLNENH